VTTYDLTDADELPIPPQRDIAFWSENYCFDAFDDVSRVGLWMHLGRWSKAPDIWREQTKIFLPDGSLLLWKTFADGRTERGPGAAALGFECVEPGRAWRLHFEGPCRHVSLADLQAGALRDGPLRHLSAAFEFRTQQPAWDLDTDAENQIWCSSHYEQHGRVTGSLRLDEEEFVVTAASAYRDHSRGPRHMKSLRRHVWIHGQTTDDLAFGLFYMEVMDKPGLSRAFMVLDRQLEEVEVIGPPYADSLDVLANPFGFGLRRAGGEQIEVTAQPVQTVVSSFVHPYEKLHGIDAAATHVSCHQTTLFTIGGQAAVGHTERSFVR
jgi:hypothetical protein